MVGFDVHIYSSRAAVGVCKSATNAVSGRHTAGHTVIIKNNAVYLLCAGGRLGVDSTRHWLAWLDHTCCQEDICSRLPQTLFALQP